MSISSPSLNSIMEQASQEKPQSPKEQQQQHPRDSVDVQSQAEKDITSAEDYEPSPLELEALRQAILQKSQSPPSELLSKQVPTGQTDEEEGSFINPLGMEAMRVRILSGEKSTFEKNVLEAARLVDQTFNAVGGGGSSGGGFRRPSGGEIKGIQSTLMGQGAVGDRASVSSKSRPPRPSASLSHAPPRVSFGQIQDSSAEKPVTREKQKKKRTKKAKRTNAYIVPRVDRCKQRVDSIKSSQKLSFKDIDERIRLTFEIANYLQKQALMRKLAISLMKYGCPAHRIQHFLRLTATAIDIDAAFVYMPDVILLSFYDSAAHATETFFLGQTQGFDMSRLIEVYRLERLITLGQTTVDDAIEYLERIKALPLYFPEWVRSLSYAFAAFASSIIFFGGGWKEAGMAAGLGLWLAIYEIFSSKLPGMGPLFDITVSIIIGFIATAVSYANICYTPTAFAAVIVLLPGWPMAMSIMELASRSIISGVIRLVYAFIYSFLLAYGLTTGQGLYRTFDTKVQLYNPDTCPKTLSNWWYFLFVPWFCICFCIFVRALPRRWPFMISVACAGYAVSYALSNWTHANNQVSQLVPALVVGLLGNLYTKITQDISFDAILLGSFLLVPGAVGLRSGLAAFSGAQEAGGNTAALFSWAVIEASIGITLGLYLSTLLFYPRGKAHTPVASF